MVGVTQGRIFISIFLILSLFSSQTVIAQTEKKAIKKLKKEVSFIKGQLSVIAQNLNLSFGTPGSNGTAGTPGQNGSQGAVGPQGPVGPKGPIGLTGAQGPQGIQGPKGEPGTTPFNVPTSFELGSNGVDCVAVDLFSQCSGANGCRLQITSYLSSHLGTSTGDSIGHNETRIVFEDPTFSSNISAGTQFVIAKSNSGIASKSSIYLDYFIKPATGLTLGTTTKGALLTTRTLAQFSSDDISESSPIVTMSNFIPAACPDQVSTLLAYPEEVAFQNAITHNGLPFTMQNAPYWVVFSSIAKVKSIITISDH